MGGKGEVEVFDYLLSTDYALCNGPVDSVNQVWVKDKPIWCGKESDRVDLDIHLPSLFGGDKAEGGVSGIVEFYPGGDSQIASQQLSWRNGLQPDTMPGYRGISHLFFRGRALAQDPDGEVVPEETGSEWSDALTAIFNFKSFKIKRGGFKWGTNNPYFPEIKANVTRCPRGLDPDTAEIWPLGSLEDNFLKYTDGKFSLTEQEENLETLVQDGSATVRTIQIDLQGFSYQGLGRYKVVLNGGFYSNGRFGQVVNSPKQGAANLIVRQYDANGELVLPPPEDELHGPSDTAVSISVDGSFTLTLEGHINKEARTVFIEHWEAPNDPLATYKIPTGPNFALFTFPDPSFHCRVDGSLGPLPDANPMHIIYECQVNEEWGQGCPPQLIDIENYKQVARTLYDEGFGLSMIWAKQGSIGDFITEVLNHIRALLFIDPATGLWTCRLLRKEENASSSPILDASNSVLFDPKRRAWGETVNEIVVSYTDPSTEEEATVSSYDFGNISMQGGVVSETRNYFGIRRADLAQRVADRDVAESAYPIFSCRFELSRRHRSVRPGDLFVVNWPDEGIDGMIVRVMKVDYGSPLDRTIKIEVVEDIFSIDSVEYRDTQGSEWVSGDMLPQALDDQLIMSMTYPAMVKNGFTFEQIEQSFPESRILIYGASDTTEIVGIDVSTGVPNPSGELVSASVAIILPARNFLIPGVEGVTILAEEAISILPSVIIDSISDEEPAPGDLFVLGNSESVHEIVMLKQLSGSNWEIARGIHDTIPRSWQTGTRIWAYRTSSSRVDPFPRSAGELVQYKLLPGTARGYLASEQTNPVSITVSYRPHMPFRPANCQINGNGFGEAVFADGFPVGGIPVTWENRNRTVEDAIALHWTETSVLPEEGQTTALVVKDIEGTEVNTMSGLTGNSYAIQEVELGGIEIGSVVFYSERDGLRSLMGAERKFDVRVGGYGLRYGEIYGGRT